MAYIQHSSPFLKKGDAPSRKKSLGYYNKANPTGKGAAAGGGMSEKGVKKYRKDNPGSKLKTAVTTPPSKLKKGSKAWKRRKSFCARSKGWTSERGRAARRRWNC
jgi:hypothetical protein